MGSASVGSAEAQYNAAHQVDAATGRLMSSPSSIPPAASSSAYASTSPTLSLQEVQNQVAAERLAGRVEAGNAALKASGASVSSTPSTVFTSSPNTEKVGVAVEGSGWSDTLFEKGGVVYSTAPSFSAEGRQLASVAGEVPVGGLKEATGLTPSVPSFEIRGNPLTGIPTEIVSGYGTLVIPRVVEPILYVPNSPYKPVLPNLTSDYVPSPFKPITPDLGNLGLLSLSKPSGLVNESPFDFSSLPSVYGVRGADFLGKTTRTDLTILPLPQTTLSVGSWKSSDFRLAPAPEGLSAQYALQYYGVPKSAAEFMGGFGGWVTEHPVEAAVTVGGLAAGFYGVGVGISVLRTASPLLATAAEGGLVGMGVLEAKRVSESEGLLGLGKFSSQMLVGGLGAKSIEGVIGRPIIETYSLFKKGEEAIPMGKALAMQKGESITPIAYVSGEKFGIGTPKFNVGEELAFYRQFESGVGTEVVVKSPFDISRLETKILAKSEIPFEATKGGVSYSQVFSSVLGSKNGIESLASQEPLYIAKSLEELRGTARIPLSNQEYDITLGLIKEVKGATLTSKETGQFYGSAASHLQLPKPEALPQTGKYVSGWGDVDLQLYANFGMTKAEFAEMAVGRYSKTGLKYGFEEGQLFRIEKSGEKTKLFDIHDMSDIEAGENSRIAYGFKAQKSVKIGTTPLMRQSEQGIRKVTSTLGIYEGGGKFKLSPELPKREKDPFSSLPVYESLLLAKEKGGVSPKVREAFGVYQKFVESEFEFLGKSNEKVLAFSRDVKEPSRFASLPIPSRVSISKSLSLSPSRSPSVSVSPSVSPSISSSRSPSISMSPSVSVSKSPSVSMSSSPSVSKSPSVSLSPSVSPSLSPNKSPSVSISPSISPSVSSSRSPSVSISPSISSVSISPSISKSPSVSVSPSPSISKSPSPSPYPSLSSFKSEEKKSKYKFVRPKIRKGILGKQGVTADYLSRIVSQAQTGKVTTPKESRKGIMSFKARIESGRSFFPTKEIESGRASYTPFSFGKSILSRATKL